MPQICQDCGLWKCSKCGQCKTTESYVKISDPRSKSKLYSQCKECQRKKRRTPKMRKYKAKKAKEYYYTERHKIYRNMEKVKKQRHQWYLNYLENGGREVRKRYQQTEQAKQKHSELTLRASKRPEHKIRAAVYRAVLKGLLPNPKTLNCCYCSNNAQQYHHPLAYKWKFCYCVIPICTTCHGKVHSKYATQRPHLIGFAMD